MRHLSALWQEQAQAQCMGLSLHVLRCMCPRRLVKAGVIPPQYARGFNLASAWAEMVGYVGSIWLNALRIAAALERERALSDELLRRKKVLRHAACSQCLYGQPKNGHQRPALLNSMCENFLKLICLCRCPEVVAMSL